MFTGSVGVYLDIALDIFHSHFDWLYEVGILQTQATKNKDARQLFDQDKV
jgi:hypothetical protein